MADISKELKKAISEIEKRFKNQDDIKFIEQKLSDITFCYIDSINMLFEIQKRQNEIDKSIKKIQSDIKNIEEDIYINQDECNDECDDEDNCNYYNDEYEDDCCEFEITCPYCDYEFITDNSSKGKNKITCPRCHKEVELDWDEDECSGECSGCNHSCFQNTKSVAENDEEYNQEQPKNDNQNNNSKNSDKQNIEKENNNKSDNNEDDM